MITDEIYKARNGKLLTQCTEKEIKELILELAVNLGTPPHGADEYAIFKESIVRTFHYFTKDEILLAVKFKQQGLIQADTETFGRPVNNNVLSKLMHAYKALKSETIVKYGRFSPEPEIPEEQKEEILRRGVIRIYNEWLKDENYLIERLFVFYPYVNYLKRRGIISISEYDKQEARKVAEEIAPQMQLKKTIVSRIVKPDQSDIEKYMEYYYLYMYFNSCKLLNKSVA